jgi:hypothetical protein
MLLRREFPGRPRFVPAEPVLFGPGAVEILPVDNITPSAKFNGGIPL